jgi:hypothetical protein
MAEIVPHPDGQIEATGIGVVPEPIEMVAIGRIQQVAPL